MEKDIPGKSAVSGKSVDLGGGGIITKNSVVSPASSPEVSPAASLDVSSAASLDVSPAASLEDSAAWAVVPLSGWPWQAVSVHAANEAATRIDSCFFIMFLLLKLLRPAPDAPPSGSPAN